MKQSGSLPVKEANELFLERRLLLYLRSVAALFASKVSCYVHGRLGVDKAHLSRKRHFFLIAWKKI